MSTYHVYPSRDLVDHDTETDDCMCGPRIEPVPSDDGSMGWIVTHHSLDGREKHEDPPMTTDPFTDAACDEAAKRWPYEPAPSVLSGARRRDRRLGFLVGAKWGRTYIERCIRALHAADADGNCGHCTRGRVYPVPAPCETVRALAGGGEDR